MFFLVSLCFLLSLISGIEKAQLRQRLTYDILGPALGA